MAQKSTVVLHGCTMMIQHRRSTAQHNDAVTWVVWHYITLHTFVATNESDVPPNWQTQQVVVHTQCSLTHTYAER